MGNRRRNGHGDGRTGGSTADRALLIETPHGTVRLDPDAAAGATEPPFGDQIEVEGTHWQATRLYRVDRRGGRSCESCARSIETDLEAIDGVASADISFLGEGLRVRYDPDVVEATDIDAAVEALEVIAHDPDVPPDGTEVEAADLRLETAFVVLTFIGMGGGLVAGYLGAAWQVEWGLYAIAYGFGGWFGLLAAVESIKLHRIDIDVLMLTAAAGAAAIGQPFEGAMLLFLFSLSNVLQRYAFGRSRRAIRSLLELRPDRARLIVDGEETAVPIEAVDLDDVFVVRPGDRIPLDGTVIDGSSAVDEASLTGESVPVSKDVGDEVFAGTIVEDGTLEVSVTRLAHESAIARMIHLVEEAKTERAPTQRLVDRLEQPYVMGVFAMTLVAIAIPAALGAEWFATVYRAMTLMVAASPCAVIISTPAVVLSAISSGARSGVLFKGGEYVESVADIDVVAFDKTGTLTEGRTRVATVHACPDVDLDDRPIDEDRLLRLAAGVQSRSEHHLARATVEAAETAGLEAPAVEGFQAVPGKGVRGTVAGWAVHIGNRRYFDDLDGPADRQGFDALEGTLAGLEAEGETSVVVAVEDGADLIAVGLLGFTDTVRPAARAAIAALRAQGVDRVLMLTGDTEPVAQAVADEVGIDEVHAELLPHQKVERVSELLEAHDGVAMVGDGVNDAPALATATVGIGMGGAGTDVALETADVVLMADDIAKLPYVLTLGHRARRTLWINFAIAFGAMGLMIIAILARGLPLPMAVVGHEGSTVLVSLNGLRLLAFRE